MTTPKIILKRGSTQQSNSYAGVIGEITYDTDINTVRVYNGVSNGGTTLLNPSSTANNTQFVGNVSAANVVSNAHLQSNLANYVTNTQFSSNLAANLANYVTNTQFSSNLAANLANYVTNTQFSSNLAANLINYVTNTHFTSNVIFLDTKLSDLKNSQNFLNFIYI